MDDGFGYSFDARYIVRKLYRLRCLEFFEFEPVEFELIEFELEFQLAFELECEQLIEF